MVHTLYPKFGETPPINISDPKELAKYKHVNLTQVLEEGSMTVDHMVKECRWNGVKQ